MYIQPAVAACADHVCSQASRKKLESRRLAYDASTTKMQKAKREDFRLEEELRSAKAKYEEASEDVFRRMQDIKDAEADSVRDLSQFLDAQLDYHERCAEELRQVRQNWPMADAPVRGAYGGGGADRHSIRSRSNTTTSYEKRLPRTQSAVVYEQDDEPEPEPVPARMPIRSISSRSVVDPPPRLSVARHNTIQAGASLERAGLSRPMAGDAGAYAVSPLNVSQLRGQLRPVSRLSPGNNDVFADRDDDTASVSGSGSPDWCERSASPATSFGSLSRSTSNAAVTNGVHSMGLGVRKVPPPPPSRAKKPPPPPVPAKRLQ